MSKMKDIDSDRKYNFLKTRIYEAGIDLNNLEIALKEERKI